MVKYFELDLSIKDKYVDIVLSKSVLLEEYARKLIVEEEMHIGEVEKMLRVNDIDDRCQ